MKIEIKMIKIEQKNYEYEICKHKFYQRWYDKFPTFSLNETLIDSTNLKDYKTIRHLSRINIIKTEIRKLNK